MPFDPSPGAAASAPEVWSGYASALVESHRGDLQAWPHLMAARQRFADDGDRRGCMLASAALMVCGQLDGNYRAFDAGLADLAPLREGAAGHVDRDEELLLLTGWLLGLLLYQPDDPHLDRCVERMLALLDGGVEVNLLLAACRALLYYVEPREKRELGLRLHALVETHAADPLLTPYRRAQWLMFWQRCALYAKQPRESERALEELRELAARHGLRQVDFMLAFHEVDAALPGGDVARAQAALERAEVHAQPARLRDSLLLEVAKSRLARMKGEVDTALLHATRARKIAQELRSPPPMLAVYIVSEAQSRLLAEDFDGARALMQQAQPLVPAGYAREIGEMIDGIAAYQAVRHGAADGLALLTRLWTGLRERQFYDCFEGYPEFSARLCVMALQHGLETEFVCSMIDKCGLAPPADAPENWPWPLRIHALGGFSVQRHGRVLGTEGKAQKKPLALLQAVIAHRATREGQGVPVPTLVDELWPDVEASDPKSSFEVTLSRLRKWLGVDGALRLVDGRLLLNARLVWCDVAAFERTQEALQRHLVPHADAAPLAALARQLGGLYRGKLFGDVAVERWAVGARERLALQFSRAVTDYGQHLETQRAWADALRLYERGLAQDMLAEPIYRALMRCHLALEQPAQARRVFLRCQEVLRASLQLPPSRQTLELATRIGAQS
ncbi:MAG: bacterial transcriptional activator domain-containing protein [Burkholderiales bacterium]|nr:bacterial transcriptional activator domain-containing protein [Burkholderiales bacterium]